MNFLCINTYFFIIDLIQIVTSVILILFYRQARCFLAQNNLTSAKQAFRQTIQALDHSNLVEEKKLKWQRDVQIMLAMLDRNKELSNKGKIKTNQEIYFLVIKRLVFIKFILQRKKICSVRVILVIQKLRNT